MYCSVGLSLSNPSGSSGGTGGLVVVGFLRDTRNGHVISGRESTMVFA